MVDRDSDHWALASARVQVRALIYALAHSQAREGLVTMRCGLFSSFVAREKTTDNQLINQWVNFDRSALRLARRKLDEKLESLFGREVPGKFRDF